MELPLQQNIKDFQAWIDEVSILVLMELPLQRLAAHATISKELWK